MWTILGMIHTRWYVAVIVLMSAIILVLHVELHISEERFIQCKADMEKITVQNHRLSEAIRQQNHAIDTLRAQEVQKSRHAAEALRVAENHTKRWKKKADTLLQYQESGSTCKDLLRLLDAYQRQAQ